MVNRRPLGFALLVLALTVMATLAVAQNPGHMGRSRPALCTGTPSLRTSFDTRALESVRRAAENGEVRAQRNLAIAFQEGRTLPRDYGQAARWYRKAAQKGDRQWLLGAAYDRGLGVPEDSVEAARWHGKPADQGQASAQLAIGSMYQRGRGGPQRDLKAAEWFRKSAILGNREGPCAIGMMCETSRGVADEYVRAFAWFDVAAKQDYRVATTARDKLQLLMAAEQIAETHKLSTELQERFRKGK